MINMQKITWIGHGSWKFVTNNGTVIYLDPWVVGNPACTISLDDTMDADIVCVTHGHDDHLGNAIEICKESKAVLVTLPDIYAYVSSHGIPYDDRGGALHVGGFIRQLDCIIYAVQALHFSDIWGEEYVKTGKIWPGSGCCGMVIRPDGGKSVYFAGDTGLFSDMKLIAKLYQPYVSVLPIGGKYVMGINEASYAAEFLDSPYVIPGHYNTFPAITADTDEFVQLVKIRAPNTKVKILSAGESFEF